MVISHAFVCLWRWAFPFLPKKNSSRFKAYTEQSLKLEKKSAFLYSLLSITALPLLLLLVLASAMLAIGKKLIQDGKTTSQDVVGTYTSLYLAAEAFGLVGHWWLNLLYTFIFRNFCEKSCNVKHRYVNNSCVLFLPPTPRPFSLITCPTSFFLLD